MKKISAFLALVLTFTTLTFSRPSHSAVGLVTLNPSLALTSVGMLAGSGLAAIFSETVMRGSSGVMGDGYGIIQLGAAFIAIVGIVTLDGEESQSIAFGPLDPKQAKQLGISAHEAEIFNSELDMANSVLNQVEVDLSKITKPSLDDGKAAWSQYEGMLAPETVKVMSTIVVSLYK